MIKRAIETKLLALAEKFQVVSLMGPRQSGKTTLVRDVFDGFPYISLENPDTRQFALADPRGFLGNYPQGVILDEVQNTPDLLSYIQSIVDEDRGKKFVLTGSANFLLLEKISQTLAGRTAVLDLLPFSMQELTSANIEIEHYETLIFKGQYPRIYDRGIAPTDFYPSYIRTYVERDVRMIKNIENTNNFIRFLKLCAGRAGQLLNYASLADDVGISVNTVKAWLSVLESSYIIYRLQPFYKNFNKRIIKSPKLYFYDTGLAASLLGIQDETQLRSHYLRGALFENLIINEFIKQNLNQGIRNYPYFWQDHRGKEIDCLLVEGDEITPIEIKSGKTISNHYFDNLEYWRKLTKAPQAKTYVVYGGDQTLKNNLGTLLSWKNLEKIHG